MPYRPSILNISAGLFTTGCIGYSIYNYKLLSEYEGWGMVGMFGLIGFGVLLLILDFVIQKTFKSTVTINILGALVVLFAALFLFW